MKKSSLTHKLRALSVSFIWLSIMSHAHAQSTESTVDESVDSALMAQDTLRQESMRMRATTVLPGHAVQNIARPPSKKKPKPTQTHATKAWGDYESPEDGLKAFQNAPVDMTLRSGEQLSGTINYYTEDAVLVVTESGSLYIIELTDIQTVNTRSQPEPPKLSLSDDAAQSFRSKQHQAIRDKIRDYRLREAHQYIGRGLRITGGVLLGVGALAEVWGLTVLTTAESGQSVQDGPFGNGMAMPVAIIGAPMIVTGVGLILGANVKRRRAIDDARQKNITYSVAPLRMKRGVGAGATIVF